MKGKEKNPGDDKISRQFAARLDALGPGDKVRAIVLLVTAGGRRSNTRRQSSAEREATVRAVRRSAGDRLSEVDQILERFGGKRLAKSPDALGSIPVETTASGISALAKSKNVKAILEDQEIRPVL